MKCVLSWKIWDITQLLSNWEGTINKEIEAIAGSVNAAICYDCLGMSNKELYDRYQIPVINILVDHPMSLAPCMKELPSKYIQLSPDENHVRYAKKYIGVKTAIYGENTRKAGEYIVQSAGYAESKFIVY